MSNSPKALSFSVIIPTYQRRALVCEAVESIRALQYDGPVELIVVSDGSTDGTAQALSEIKMPFRFEIIDQKNGGLANARNVGARSASGDVLLFLDDDMVAAPDLLLQHARSYSEGADAVVGEIPLDPRSPKGFLTKGISDWATKAANDARSLQTLTPFNVFGGQISVRKLVFEALGGFDSGFTNEGKYGLEDADFAVRLLGSYNVRHNPDAITHHRYVVSPREYLRRGFELGRATVRFSRRHLAYAPVLFDLNHAAHPVTRFLIRPLGSVPLLHLAVAELGSLLAHLVLATPWRSSRIFAKIFFGCRMIGFWAGVQAAGGIPYSRRALILCYHAIADHRSDPILRTFSVPESRFRRNLDSLARRQFVFVSPDDILSALRDGQPLPRRSVLLTFDDCYADLLTTAQDILKPRGIPALAFAVTATKAFTNEWDIGHGAHCHRLLDWSELKQLRDSNVELGSHSRTHRSMPLLTDAELAQETELSAEDFEANGLPRPRFFCFPFGETDKRVSQAAARAGYAAAFGLSDRHADASSDLFDLPRVEVLSTDSSMMFRLKTSYPQLANRFRIRAWTRRLIRQTKAFLQTVRSGRQSGAGAI